MTTFYLARHGACDHLNQKLVGRSPGVHLNAEGQSEAGNLAAALAAEGIDQLFSSPLERCMETAGIIAGATGRTVESARELIEVDFGDWTGRSFAELESEELWRRWNLFRSGERAPNGETMLEVQSRMVGFIERKRREAPGRRFAVVTHGDPLRSVILYFLGIPSEFIRRIEIGTASLTVAVFTDWEMQFRRINHRFGKGSV